MFYPRIKNQVFYLTVRKGQEHAISIYNDQVVRIVVLETTLIKVFANMMLLDNPESYQYIGKSIL